LRKPASRFAEGGFVCKGNADAALGSRAGAQRDNRPDLKADIRSYFTKLRGRP